MTSKRKSGKKKKVIIIVTVFFSLLLVGLISAYALFKHYAGMLNYEPMVSEDIVDIEPEDTDFDEDSPYGDIEDAKAKIDENLEADMDELPYKDDVFNVLLIGSDERSPSSRGRSDTMMIISINKRTKQIVMSSLLRDTYISIPKGIGYSRLNAAYAYGGPSLLMETIKQNFGIPIDKYMQVGFDAFTSIVDVISGVRVTLRSDEVDYINKRLDSGSKKLEGSGGDYLLNGTQALIYARIRYLDSDFGRTERQRSIITSVIGKARKMSIPELNEFLKVLLPQITTNLTESELLSFVLSSVSYLDYDLVSFTMPMKGSWSDLIVNGMMVLSVDFSANRSALIKTIYGE
jgi:cell envelope-related function transcriptional attenuator common domain